MDGIFTAFPTDSLRYHLLHQRRTVIPSRHRPPVVGAFPRLETSWCPDGGSKTFTVAAPAGKVLDSLVVDTAPVEECLVEDPTDCWVPTQYTFTDVTDNHTIVAVFSDAVSATAASNTINASASGGGSIFPNGDVAVPDGGSKTFTIATPAGKVLDSLVVDTAPVEECLVEDPTDCWVPTQYTFTDVTDNHTIVAVFSDAGSATAASNTINASASGGGSIFPNGDVAVPDGGSKTFTIATPAGKVLDSLVRGHSPR